MNKKLIFIGIFSFILFLSLTKPGRKFFMSLASDIITKWEGLRLDVYLDVVGKWTVGYGHLIKPGEKYYPYGTVKNITKIEAENLLEQDLNLARDCVSQYVKVTLTENQRASLVSFTFNLGCTAFQKSTLLKLVNQQKFSEAAEQFDKWVYARGADNLLVKVNGLVNRREAEKQTFIT